jgi:hypothetical protein
VYLDATILESPVASAAFQRLNKALTSFALISPSTLALELRLRLLRQRDPKRFSSVEARPSGDKMIGLRAVERVTWVVAGGANAEAFDDRNASRTVVVVNFMVVMIYYF